MVTVLQEISEQAAHKTAAADHMWTVVYDDILPERADRDEAVS
jgi:hypothetical protein